MLQKEIVRKMSKEFDNPNMRRVQKPSENKEKEGKYPVRGPMIEQIEKGAGPEVPRQRRKKRKRKSASEREAELRKRQQLVENISRRISTVHERFKEKTEPLYEKRDAEIRSILTEAPEPRYPGIRSDILFHDWAPYYDPFMEITNHTPSLSLLLNQALEIDRVKPDYSSKPIIGPKIIEVAAGTGTVIDLLCRKMPPEEVAKLHITLNDTSDPMMAQAQVKLKKLAEENGLKFRLNYSHYNIQMMPYWNRAKKDTAIMSQVLHFITDPKALEEERSDSLEISYMKHTVAKIKAIKRIFKLLRQNGYFVLIEEWPARLSRTRIPEAKIPGVDDEKLRSDYDRAFRPVEHPMVLRTTIMDNVPRAKLVAVMKIPIDHKHSMYLLVYRKENLNHQEGKVSDDAVNATQEKLVETFKATDKHFLERYRMNSLSNGNGPLVEFLPMETEPIFDSRNGKKVPSKADKKRYRGFILAGEPYKELHNLPNEKRIAMMQNVIDTIDTGGWLMVMGEWPEAGEGALTKQAFSETLMRNFPNVMNEAALRGRVQHDSDRSISAYLYRKRG